MLSAQTQIHLLAQCGPSGTPTSVALENLTILPETISDGSTED